MLSAANASRSRFPRVLRIEPAPLILRQHHEALKLCQLRNAGHDPGLFALVDAIQLRPHAARERGAA